MYWIYRRLYELGETWAIDIPYWAAPSSSERLVGRTHDVTKSLREFGGKYAAVESTSEQKWSTAGLEAHMSEDFSQDRVIGQQRIDEMASLQTEIADKFRRDYLADVRAIRNAALLRLPPGPPSREIAEKTDDCMIVAALERIGAHDSKDVFQIANYLDELAGQLALKQ